jgi:hypothetical protein
MKNIELNYASLRYLDIVENFLSAASNKSKNTVWYIRCHSDGIIADCLLTVISKIFFDE